MPVPSNSSVTRPVWPNAVGCYGSGWADLPETGETRLRLREAHFCRVRHCPVCQWRRSLMWQARFYQSLPKLVTEHPKARWLFLTLTVRNCPITELGETLTAMNAAWQRLKDRKEFRPVLGWVRTTEVTRGKDGSARPAFSRPADGAAVDAGRYPLRQTRQMGGAVG